MTQKDAPKAFGWAEEAYKPNAFGWGEDTGKEDSPEEKERKRIAAELAVLLASSAPHMFL